MDLGFDVVALPETDHVAAGDRAPDFTRPLVTDEFWTDRALSELLADGPVLLLFHPADGAFPTTYIWKEVAARDWATGRARVVGVSVSSPYEHKQLVRDRGLEACALYSDPAAGVAAQYGVENDLDGMTGVVEHRPAVYLVAPDRTVEYAWVADEWRAFPDYDAVGAALADLD